MASLVGELHRGQGLQHVTGFELNFCRGGAVRQHACAGLF